MAAPCLFHDDAAAWPYRQFRVALTLGPKAQAAPLTLVSRAGCQYRRALEDDRSFTWIYFGVIACALVLGWLVGRIIPRQLSI
jgi:hypothetical protein